jgi:Tfp pilus assembly protein PilE
MLSARAAQTRAGVSFLELTIVLVVIALLTAGGLVKVREARKNACRIRATAALEDVHRIEVLHAAVHTGYTGDFAALRSLGLAEELDPLYRFALASADPATFTCSAAANLDGDADVDSLTVNETGVVLTIVKD